jgi:hypothetical protein
MRAIPRSIFLSAESAQNRLVRATFDEKTAQQMSKQVSAKQVTVVR